MLAANTSIAKLSLPSLPPRLRLDYLDGIRGLAALFVVAHHLWREYTHVALPGLKGIFTNWLLYGHLSVDVFIVLSGFCLMLPVARTRSLRGGWKTFYKSRARRILPPFYAAVVLALAANIAKDVPPSWETVLANLLLLQDVVQKTNVLDGPLWSVALEWKIYFLFPLFVWLWLRFGSPLVLLVSAVIGYGLTGLLAAFYSSLYLALACPWYIFLFGIGMTATVFASKSNGASLSSSHSSFAPWLLPFLFWTALVCVGLILYQWPVTSAGETAVYAPHLPIIDAAVGIAAALGLVLLTQKAERRTQSLSVTLLSWRPLVFLGTIGYSIYLVHGIIIYKIKAMLIAYLPVHPAFVVILLDIIIVVGISYLFHLAFERPFMSKPAPKTKAQAESMAVINPAP